MELLANGFTVVYREMMSKDEAIVLAKNEVRQEFATWFEAGHTYWGHYFGWYLPNTTREGAESEAIRDFNFRVARGY